MQKGYKFGNGAKMVVSFGNGGVTVSIKTPGAKRWESAAGKASVNTEVTRVADIIAYNTLKKHFGGNSRGRKTKSYDWVKLAEKIAGGVTEDAKVKI